ncbi:uncharacterized protein LOC129923331 [Biomphalaria glabrata]|uniref:Uncharacterized protein LOC129923331 n=1 Tax=Biomphalaria glabrata TaxID=6526 RepID=A0A9W2Z433_BIOGL|nr:uncharacterized protein LOC129923331 [Biomphalaria glabrata]
MLTSIRRNHKLSNRRIAKFSSGYESSRSTSRDSATDNSEKSSTPYRLPKLLLDSDDGFVEKESEVKEVEQIFGRFGYEYVVRLPELKPLTPAEIISPQRLLSQRYRQVSLVPRLRTAEILPEYRHTPSLERENRSSTDDDISPHSLEQK